MTDFLATARSLVEAERKRQIAVEGWTLAHDDEHSDGEMLRAAMIYMHWGTGHGMTLREDGAPLGWPWDVKWWKPKTRARNLERAGALLLAERERLTRVVVHRIAPRPRSRLEHLKTPSMTPDEVRRGLPTTHVSLKLDLCISALAAVLETGA